MDHEHSNTQDLLSRFSDFVASYMGLYFPADRWDDLRRGIRSAAPEFGFADEESCMQWLLSSTPAKDQIAILSGHLTVGETYFFRERNSFDILEREILPELIHSRNSTGQRLRLWSAACCTGEEPYSIAMLLHQLIPAVEDWNITILATDINPHFLRKAAAGMYHQWSFRDTPQWIREKYFTKTKDGHWEILPTIKKMTTYSYLNLAEDCYPELLNNTNGMDVIFCRNVLMYFAPECAKRVVEKLYRCLVDGGWLIVSPSEASHVLFSQFLSVSFPGTILYRKEAMKSKETEGFVPVEMHMPIVPLETSIYSESLNSRPEIHQEMRSEMPEPLRPSVESADANLFREALAQYQKGFYGETIDKLLNHLGRQGEKDVKTITLLARAYANQGEISKALDWCDKAVSSEKLNAALHYLRATILQELGSIEEATISLKRAVYLDQNFVLAYFTLGMLAQQQGKTKESGKHFKNALLLLKDYSEQEILPESEGITAKRLMEIIQSRGVVENHPFQPPLNPSFIRRGKAYNGYVKRSEVEEGTG